MKLFNTLTNKKEEQIQDLKVESLDDLFEDEPIKEENKPEINIKQEETKQEEFKTLDLSDFEEEAPILPQEPEEDDTYDLQKELEAKFDELFGPLDEE